MSPPEEAAPAVKEIERMSKVLCEKSDRIA
jgi:hypothetical protein